MTLDIVRLWKVSVIERDWVLIRADSTIMRVFDSKIVPLMNP